MTIGGAFVVGWRSGEREVLDRATNEAEMPRLWTRSALAEGIIKTSTRGQA
jgi:hypothetical protein